MHLASGTLLQGGKYKIEKVLGQGSFGITYLAEHTTLSKKVCIKEFFMKELNSRGDDGSITGLSDGSLSYNYAQKFRKEAQNLARMEHPNIVRVTDCFDENATFYYVMEYIEGQDLNTYIKQHTLSEAEAVAIIKDVANSLIYMHEEKHMLHLDLKPGNVMRRNSDGHIFLIDFGLSKNYDKNGAPETSTTIGLGTAGYAPIEQANQAKNGEFRPTIDVYALGATLYKLLTRETPPPASELVTDDELISDKLKEHNISDAISSVVVNAMLPNVRKRTQAIKAFVEAIPSNIGTSSSIITKPKEKKEEKINEHVLETTEETVVIGMQTSEDVEKIQLRKEAAEAERKRKQAEQRQKELELQKKQSEEKAEATNSMVRFILIFVSIIAIICGAFFYNSSKSPKEVANKTIVISNGPSNLRSFVYSGTIDSNEIPNGEGVAKYPETKTCSSATFKGSFVDGLPQKGTITFSSGMKFSGNFSNGYYNDGTLTDSDGYYYKGTFSNGQPLNGTWYTPSGNVDSEVINGK